MNQTEAELESFRQKWRAEVNARGVPPAKRSQKTQTSSSATPSKSAQQVAPLAAHAAAARHHDGWNEIEPRTYHDLEPRESGHILGDASAKQTETRKPESALDHYEEAVAKENEGKLGDSVRLYREAFKLDAKVHEAYKNKHFPTSSFPPKAKSTATSGTDSQANLTKTQPGTLDGIPPTLSELLSEFSVLSIEGEKPPTELSPPPPCPIATLPEEILADILLHVAIEDVGSFARLAVVCKRMAFLVMTEERVWKRVCSGQEFGFSAMHYKWVCEINGDPVSPDTISLLETMDETSDLSLSVPIPRLLVPLVPSVYKTYRSMFRHRPRIRFNGCYISTVNYNRPGAASVNSSTWNTPILIVTYYRYLRFFRDGTVISLMTTAEPADVVHYLWPEHMHSKHTGNLPEAVMKEALRGRWKLSGPDDAVPTTPEETNEPEGTLTIETDGSVARYMFRMCLSIGSAGRGARNNKLSWQGYWSHNRTSDDWAEFTLKHDKPFYWSRVKSYGIGL